MQATRQQIINILNEKGRATVDDLAEAVGLTPMAVRHHLNVLQAESLITSTTMRRRRGPGRPSQIYKLTEEADALFPSDYSGLTDYILDELALELGEEEVIKLFKRIAQRLANEAPPPKDNQTIEDRLDELVDFLTEKGFISDWETREDKFLVHSYSCPYRRVAKEHSEVCLLDQQIISTMLNTTPTRTACLRSADGHCTYQIAKPIELYVD